jgi:hypothetical protein
MASVQAIPNAVVSIAHVWDPNIRPTRLGSTPIGITTHTHTQHFIKARAGTEIAILVEFDLLQNVAQTFPGNYVEVNIRIDGAPVTHARMHINDIARNNGEVWFDTFTEQNTNGSTKRAESRKIGKGMKDIIYFPLQSMEANKLQPRTQLEKTTPLWQAPARSAKSRSRSPTATGFLQGPRTLRPLLFKTPKATPSLSANRSARLITSGKSA